MSRTDFDAAPVLARLTAFQRATVDHVTRRFYGPTPSRRFLVADETGLGKSVVARGVVARTIEALQHDPNVERIDVVYVCSSADLAQQNITRLDVTGDPHLPFASRLTLLAKHAQQLAVGGGRFTKPVNLISFTPGTSFDMGWQTGKAEERAMLFLLLERLLDLSGGPRRRAALNLLRGQVSHHDRFLSVVQQLERDLAGDIDRAVATGFAQAVRRHGLLHRFDELVGEMHHRHNVPEALHEPVRLLTGRMRAELARVSVHTLQPDLVILDEFQRFRHLLDQNTEAGQLAHHLFNYGQTRVLLLSATPYKPFTYAEEGDDDHQRDFQATLTFLADGSGSFDPTDLTALLGAYRHAAVTGEPVDELTRTLRRQLLTVMCRSERPDTGAQGMLSEHVAPAAPSEEDLLGYVALSDVARAIDEPISLDYWKSAPFFINFCDGYRLGTQLRAVLTDADERARLLPLLRRTQRLNRGALRRFQPIDYGNARVRRLAADTVDRGWWQLLWLPPSLPYLTAGGPYAEPMATDVTKRLVFSSWSATPTAIAALLSYEAERCLAEGSPLTENTPTARRAMPTRLAYSLERDRPQAMTTLALFWPMPGLAGLADPLTAAATAGGPVDTAVAESALAAQLAADLPTGATSRGAASEAWYWSAALGRADSLPDELADDRNGVVAALLGELDFTEDGTDDPRGLAAHVDLALAGRQQRRDLPAPPPDLAATLAALAMHSPANVAWRALHRVAHDEPAITAAGHWQAAALLAGGLRSLFSRVESSLLLGKLLPDIPYWRAVLRYSAWGNLQAVLDEYIHHLVLAEGSPALDDDRLADIAAAAAEAIALRPSRYEAFDPLNPQRPIPFTSRFALRYGGRRQNQEDARQPEIRRAFNSPFWPFILATTSVGQEGIDFHWWSHAVVHWNTPANPVDFEQREGRVNRYAGHAIRRNIAHRHGTAVLSRGEPNPWRTAYEVAAGEDAGFGEFAPHWVYLGPARVQRHLAFYPLSVDAARLDRLKNDLALYRLTFGQPRQEDMLELLRRRGLQHTPDRIDQLRVDLRPPTPDETM
jgi:hypothetical protein